jgi:signal transduction histidine kinase/predicted CoA-binding protein
LLAISQDQFLQLLDSSPSAARTMLNTVLSRWRSTESNLRQSEKLALLGNMSAGLAHELNNPAAAVQRGAEQLQSAVQKALEAQTGLYELNLDARQHEILKEIEERSRERSRQPEALDSLARADLQEALEDWLETQGVEDAWEVAPTLVSIGLAADDLGKIIDAFPEEKFQLLVSYAEGLYSQGMLMAEIHEGAVRISELVKSLKSYVYLDQAPVKEVDVHEGLESTLVLLRNKLKHGITVQREYAKNLPRIQAYGSELNQVWTNLIDNAADAMEGQGELLVRTREENGWVVVEIVDNGPGIPPEIQGKVFDPFFTTKPQGKGTGMGLDISWNIIVNRHRGDIKVYSEPGATCFQVWLPVNFEAAGSLPSGTGSGSMDDADLLEILEGQDSIAVVGISNRADRPAGSVPAYLQNQGYRIIPVNGKYETVLGSKAYARLADIPEPVDTVLVFRPGEETPPIVDQAIRIGAKTVWMQEGIYNQEAAQAGRQAGLKVVMDTCMRTTHRRLVKK